VLFLKPKETAMARRLSTLCLKATLPALVAALGAAPAHAQTTPLGTVSAVLIGQQDSAGILPAFNLGQGTPTANLDVALPLGTLTRGQAYTVMIMSQVGSFIGTCKTFYSLTQGTGATKTTLLQGHIAPYSCSTGQIFGWALNTRTLGGNAGPATLTGQMTLGTQKVVLNVPVILQ
jgi:hypothetical protein